MVLLQTRAPDNAHGLPDGHPPVLAIDTVVNTAASAASPAAEAAPRTRRTFSNVARDVATPLRSLPSGLRDLGITLTMGLIALSLNRHVPHGVPRPRLAIAPGARIVLRHGVNGGVSQ
jgi:hypothetical protein